MIIPTRNGHEFEIDDLDLGAISGYNWYAYRHYNVWYVRGYHTETLKYTSVHRVVMNAIPGQIVDHIDGNGLNNKKNNLRFVTVAQNRFNSQSTNKPGRTSAYKGVSYVKREKVWRAFIYLNRRQLYLGRFETEIEAAIAYNNAALQLYGEYARVNIVGGLDEDITITFSSSARFSDGGKT